MIAQTEGKSADIVIETGGVDTPGPSIAAGAINARITVVGDAPYAVRYVAAAQHLGKIMIAF